MKVEWDFSELNRFARNLTNTSNFERQMKFAAKELAHELLRMIKNFTPVGDTYQLMNGWSGNAFAVKRVAEGFEVLIVNRDRKALWVNDGHRVRNQKNGPYLTVHRRIKVPTAYKWQKNTSNLYVFGHFFVERGILQLGNTTQVEDIITKKLQKWWDSI